MKKRNDTNENGFTSYKNRTINLDKEVYVYRNLNRGGYSIKQFDKVVAHSNVVYIKDCEFIVNEKNRLRVLKTGVKNVHAFIKGYFIFNTINSLENYLFIPIKYNPKLYGYFYIENKISKPINGAYMIVLDENGAKAAFIQ